MTEKVETRVRVPCGLKKRLNMNKIKEVWRVERGIWCVKSESVDFQKHISVNVNLAITQILSELNPRCVMN